MGWSRLGVGNVKLNLVAWSVENLLEIRELDHFQDSKRTHGNGAPCSVVVGPAIK